MIPPVNSAEVYQLHASEPIQCLSYFHSASTAPWGGIVIVTWALGDQAVDTCYPQRNCILERCNHNLGDSLKALFMDFHGHKSDQALPYLVWVVKAGW